MDELKKIIKKMKKRAKDLRDDTLVSMNEGIANEITAHEIDKWIVELENSFNTVKY